MNELFRNTVNAMLALIPFDINLRRTCPTTIRALNKVGDSKVRIIDVDSIEGRHFHRPQNNNEDRITWSGGHFRQSTPGVQVTARVAPTSSLDASIQGP